MRHLIETTTYSYKEITKRTGVPHATIATWLKNGKWARPLFAPRANDTVPRWRARLRLRRRTLASRLYDLAGRCDAHTVSWLTARIASNQTCGGR